MDSGNQHATRMHHFVIYDLSGATIYFHIISKRHDIRKKKVIVYEMCVLIFCTNFSETCFILRRNERDMIQNVYLSSCKVHVVLVPPQLNLNFLDRFSKNTQISNVKKIRPFGAELFHADGRKGTET